jgi:hypothetical protein
MSKPILATGLLPKHLLVVRHLSTKGDAYYEAEPLLENLDLDPSVIETVGLYELKSENAVETKRVLTPVESK